MRCNRIGNGSIVLLLLLLLFVAGCNEVRDPSSLESSGISTTNGNSFVSCAALEKEILNLKAQMVGSEEGYLSCSEDSDCLGVAWLDEEQPLNGTCPQPLNLDGRDAYEEFNADTRVIEIRRLATSFVDSEEQDSLRSRCEVLTPTCITHRIACISSRCVFTLQ